jgi:hypothetical protein
MADQLARSDRSDADRYQALRDTANENEKGRSPGWTSQGNMPAQQASANEYDKAAQEKQQQSQSPRGELTEKARAAYEAKAQQMAAEQKQDRGQDRAQEQQRSRGMDFSR